MPHYAKCDVISRQNKKFKLKFKYFINKTMQRKSAKELVLQFLNTLSHYDRAVASSIMGEGGGADIHILVLNSFEIDCFYGV